jgi:hypothetical protein
MAPNDKGMPLRPAGFVALSSLKRGNPSTDDALAEIRRIYFTTTARTIEHDVSHAIELLKGLETEAAREKASVFMEGLAELRKEWYRPPPSARRPPAPSNREPRPGPPARRKTR